VYGLIEYCDDRYSHITYSYNAGNISSESGVPVGGLSNSKAMENCFFIDTTDTATPDGALFANVSKLSAEQMRSKESFAGFDFDAVWEIGMSAEYPYPTLRGNQ
jgi:hypothetical protein